MLRLSSIIYILCVFALLTACGEKKQERLVPAERADMREFLKDTVCDREIAPEEGAARLQQLLRLYSDKASWEERQKCLREGLRHALGLDPAPEKNPIIPLWNGQRECDHYSVDNVAFECVPGVWVIGNLYRPRDKIYGPAILSAHGHAATDPPEDGPRVQEYAQQLAATLARMGAVVFVYDMFAYGESIYHAGHRAAHHTALTGTIQTWSSIRAIDFLTTLKEVDPKRIGMTGWSGGGTQTFLAAALDDRIAVSVPVVQVSCFFPGGCACESGRPIRSHCDFPSNNAEIAALAAPRPQLIISDGNDWTRTTPQVEYPYLRTIYGLYGCPDYVENAHFVDENHDYGYNKRCAAYRFFADRLGLNLQSVARADGTIDESKTTLFSAEELAVFPDHKLPEGALHTMEDIFAAFFGHN